MQTSMKKRGLSGVVTTIIIILIAIVAAGLVGVFIINTIQDSSEEATITSFTNSIIIENAIIEGSNLKVEIKRTEGDANMTELTFIISDGENRFNHKETENLPKALETRTFEIDFIANGLLTVEEISVFPSFNDKIGIEVKKDVTEGVKGLDTDGDGTPDSIDDDDDGDGILDDGDFSGIIGDNACTGGAIITCDDNCQLDINSLQEDNDGDGLGDICDNDIDGDGALNADDTDDLNPLICSDIDSDTCDDCSSGTFDIANDGADGDGDGLCDLGDACPTDPDLNCVISEFLASFSDPLEDLSINWISQDNKLFLYTTPAGELLRTAASSLNFLYIDDKGMIDVDEAFIFEGRLISPSTTSSSGFHVGGEYWRRMSSTSIQRNSPSLTDFLAPNYVSGELWIFTWNGVGTAQTLTIGGTAVDITAGVSRTSSSGEFGVGYDLDGGGPRSWDDIRLAKN